MGDVGSGHVAADQNGTGGVRAYGGMEHGPPPAWANDLEVPGTRAARVCQDEHGQSNSKEEKDHLFLFFAFDTIVSLSFWQKVRALSNPFRAAKPWPAGVVLRFHCRFS